ncbi:hypothetical protein SAMN05428950_1011829 [Sphingomonas sp. OV641]|uniref:hypothetical protein n=1 Tax=Sphingomonas sp. OV641 TaxID=1881068 RepID=UPI0008C5BFDA|nr:hypothetical protein [Sphingomonas sp. OV641]SEJ32001.1 hypothetical protein SAMN05428950_1011829 [Sphingomonas sp. OV641]
MARRFIVHVGAPKTGTSAFQEWAVANRAALIEAGFFYPETGATHRGNHAALVSALGGAIEDEKRRAHLFRLFERELQPHPDAAVILSAETMTTLRFLPNMPRLNRALGEYGDEATVVLVVRDQVEWRNSCYAQAREMMTRLPRFRDYVAVGKHGPRGGNWDFLEEKYREAGFDFATLAFDKRVRDRGIVNAMTSLPCLAGLAGIAGGDRTETNPSAGAFALLVAEQLRTALGEQATALPMHIRQKLAAMIAKHAHDRPQMRFNGFDTAMAEEMRAMYRDGNDAFAQRHFGASWDELFPPKPIQYVSRDALDELDAPDRREISIIAGQVMIEALESGLLHLSANPPANT